MPDNEPKFDQSQGHSVRFKLADKNSEASRYCDRVHPDVHGTSTQSHSWPMSDAPSSSPAMSQPRFQKPIKDQKLHVQWFQSSGDRHVSGPLPCDPLDLGDLYMHKSPHGTQVWLWTQTSWEEVQLNHPHPTLHGHFLRLTEAGEPDWVLNRPANEQGSS